MDKSTGWVVGRIAGAPVLLKPSALVMVGVLTLLFVPTVRTVSQPSPSILASTR